METLKEGWTIYVVIVPPPPQPPDDNNCFNLPSPPVGDIADNDNDTSISSTYSTPFSMTTTRKIERMAAQDGEQERFWGKK